MRHDAPFVVKRIGPMIGRPESARRIAVEHNAYTLAEALEYATAHVRRRATLAAMVAREGLGGDAWQARTIRELERTATWIERRGKSATISRARRPGGEGAP